MRNNEIASLFAGRNLDLIVAMGAPAARFFLRNRAQFLPSTPLLITGTDERALRGAALIRADGAA